MRSIVVFLLAFGPVWNVPAVDASEPDAPEKAVAGQPEKSASDSGSGPVETLDLDAIVVSATRTERPRFTTPAAVSTIRREQIETIQPYGFQDVFESIPSVSIQGGPRRIAEEPSIRGFTDEQVVIRLDGTRQNFNKAHGGRFLLDPDLIRSIEVLRGASSAVYGSGALGGVFVTETVNGRDLTGDRDGAGVRLKGAFASNGEEWSSFNTVYGQAGTFDFLGSFIYRDVGENLEDGNGDDILATRDEITNGLVKLGIEPGRHQRIELAWDAFDNTGINPPNANDFATPTNIVDRDTERTNTRARYQFDDPSNRWFNVDTAVYRNEVKTIEFRFDDERIDRTDFETTGFELTNTSRLTAIAGDWLQLTYGMEFYTDEQAGTRNGGDRLQFPDAEVDYRAGFVQAEIPLPAGFSLIPGLRFDSFEYTSDGDFAERDDEETSPRVALGWQPVESLYLWTEYAEAFRAPSLTELFADGVHFTAPLGPGQVVINEFIPAPELAPEQAEQIQVGGRFRQRDLFGTGFGFSAEAVWHRSKIDNFVDQVVEFISGPPQFDPRTQTLVFPGTTTSLSVDAELSGFEFDARLEHPTGYLRAAIATLDSDRNGGGNLAGVQPDRASLGAGLYALDRQLTIGAQVIAAAARRNVPQDAPTTPGFGKTDLFVNYLPYRGPLAGWELRLALDNIFDKDYRIHPNPVQQPGRSVRMTIARDFQWLR
ncbi:MAG: TonB-dependent receptor [Wenzhouxiangellaceae bacterium]